MNNCTQGFTLIELLIIIAIIGILAAVLIPNLLSARNRAITGSTQAFVRSVVTGIEIQRDSVTGSLAPPAPSCFAAVGKAALPASVKTCTVLYGTTNKDAFVVNASSTNNVQFTYNGSDINTGSSVAP